MLAEHFVGGLEDASFLAAFEGKAGDGAEEERAGEQPEEQQRAAVFPPGSVGIRWTELGRCHQSRGV